MHIARVRRLLALLLWAGVSVARADVVVVVSARSTLEGITPEHCAAAFLGKIRTLPDGTPAYPVDQAEGSSVRDEFYARVVGKGPDQLRAYWSKMIFTGKGRPPPEMSGDAAVKRYVAERPGAIGYIERASVDASVRVVFSHERN